MNHLHFAIYNYLLNVTTWIVGLLVGHYVVNKFTLGHFGHSQKLVDSKYSAIYSKWGVIF